MIRGGADPVGAGVRGRAYVRRGPRRLVLVAGLVASGACDTATGPNEAPAANFQSPAHLTSVAVGATITFIGAGTDAEDGVLEGQSLAWASDTDGALGTGSPLPVSTLSEGVHIITLTVTDSDGGTGRQSRAVIVGTSSPVQVVTTSPLPEGTVGTVYAVFMQATGGSGTYSWALLSGALPDGLALTEFGALEGTPRVSGVYDFTLSLRSGEQQVDVGLRLAVRPMPGAVNMGYVFVPYPNATYTASSEEASNLTGGEVEVRHTGIGSYRVTFTNFGTDASRATAFVNTVQEDDNDNLESTPAACDLTDVRIEGTSGIVDLICRNAVTGNPEDSRFRALLVGEDALPAAAAFGLHDQLGRAAGHNYTPSAASAWNSAGAAQNIENLGGGRFRHDVGASLGVPRALLVASFDAASLGRCLGWTTATFLSGSVESTCNSRAGTPADAKHTIMVLERGRPGSPWAFAHVTDAGVTDPDHTNNPFGAVTVADGGTGRTTLAFTGIDAGDTSPAVHVTPRATSGWAYCSHLRVINSPVTVDVACFDQTGEFVDVAFDVVILK